MAFNIADVASLLGLQTVSKGYAPQGTVNIVCPYCGDTRGKCNLIIARGDKKDIFHCFNCEAKGTMLNLYADMKNLTDDGEMTRTKRAYFELKKIFDEGGSVELPKSITPKAKAKEEEKASDAILNKTYRLLLTYLKLEPKHKEDLKRRGLTDQEIEFYGFKSTPSQTDAKAICRCLLSEGCTLRGVPGFYLDDKRDWTINVYKGNAGYFCPVFTTEQNLVGFQIRVDKPKDGTKYIWFTSAGRNHGTSSGSPVTLLWGSDRTEAMIVEGVLKASVVHAMSGKTVIGIPGVNNLSNLPATLSKMKDLKTIYEAMDMDKFLSVTCDHEEKEDRCLSCKTPDGVCPYKELKRKRICEGRDKVISLCKAYKRILMRWDFSIKDGATVWNGLLKGPDDYLYNERKKRNAL